MYGYSIASFDPALLAAYVAAIGAKHSAHKLGKALDLHCEDLKGLREWY